MIVVQEAAVKMNIFDPHHVKLTKYLFYTGKGGVGKTSIACATAVSLADSGKRVLLISTDPASNLQDVFSIPLTNEVSSVPTIPNLFIANLDPVQAAAEYRENVIAPYRGKLPQAALVNMEEQLSGSCTIEIAAFNKFSNFLTDDTIQKTYDYIIFDTAPTGHTLRMLQLPSAWTSFISESTHGASCLGQLSGLENKKTIYRQAVTTLSNREMTTIILVTRPEITPLAEAARAHADLFSLGISNQLLIINGILPEHHDKLSASLYRKQQTALNSMPKELQILPCYEVPLRAYNVTGIENVRAMLHSDHITKCTEKLTISQIPNLNGIVNELSATDKRVIFTMGKGGVGKTTIAAAVALNLANRGKKVHLTTTDPAAHLKFVLNETCGITMSHIDEIRELQKYQSEVIDKAHAAGISDADMAYIKEDLQSPCTQEIAVFRAFAEIVAKADDEIIVIDTAPSGHTLLLLQSTQNYDHEIKRTKGETSESIKQLLPRLKSSETAVLIVTLPEVTPVYEALRLEDDLNRAGIPTKWWIINKSLQGLNTSNPMLTAKAENEIEWINRINRHTAGKFSLITWHYDELKGDLLMTL